MDCPHDATVKTARLTLRGKLIVFVALSEGTTKTLPELEFPPRAEIGIIMSAGSTVSSPSKKVATSVVL